MSILLLGMSGRYVGEQAAPTGLSIRQRILDDLEATLLLVQSVRAEGRADNASADVAYVAGGAYTGTVTRRYKATVVTGGASGTATITVTDDTPTAQRDRWTYQDEDDVGDLDDGPVAAVVTSGTAIDLGTAGLGVTLTLTFSGVLVAGDYWYVWAGPFQSAVEQVARKMDTRDGGCWIEMQAPQQTSVPGPLPLQANTMEVALWCYVPRSEDPHDAVERLLADVTNAVRLDPTRGALAVNTLPQDDVAVVLDDTKSRSWFVLRLAIRYRHRDNDTRSL